MSNRQYPSGIFVQSYFFPLCIECNAKRKKLELLQYGLIGTKKKVGERDPSMRWMNEKKTETV